MSQTLTKLQDKVIVITGASGGIGAAAARLVSAHGAKVVLAARRADALREVAASCSGETLAVVTDVTRRADHERLLAEAIARFGHVDAWVNNAGRGITRSVLQVTDADLDEMMNVNMKSALYGMQVVTPHFQTRGTGHVINVSSMLGRIPMAPFRSAYCAAKHALNALTSCLRQDLAATHPGITVTTVSPGIVATDFGNNSLGGGPDSRVLPHAQDVAEVAEVIARTLAEPTADVYTRPGMRDMAVKYFGADDLAEAEKGFTLRTGR
jgi:NADP-dependent 3-hydroxy acid dehydrogenase YdfG